MAQSNSAPLPSPSPTGIRRLWEAFIRPHESLVETEAQQNSRLLAIMMGAILLVGLPLLLLIFTLFPNELKSPDLQGLSLLIMLVSIPYSLNRVGYFAWAARLLVFIFAVCITIPSFQNNASALSLTLNTITILMAGIFLSQRQFLWTGFGLLGLVLLLFVIYTNTPSSEVGRESLQYTLAWFLLIFVFAMVGTFISHLHRTEAMRRAALEQANAQLRESEASLEHKVQERTLELEQAKTEAERANHVKSAFLASMSHELRTPLNAVINFTKFVVQGDLGEVNEEQVETLNEVIASGRHLLSLINDVLDMSKIEAGALNLFIEDNVNLQQIVDNAATTGKGLLTDKPVKLELDIDGPLPVIRADRQRILQILLNLMSNACKFTTKGNIKLSAHRQGEIVVIRVQDSGSGIAPADQPKVFEAFKQTSEGLRQGGGTGLGMAISKNLAEAHGGTLSLESTLGEGTTFTLQLPIRSEALVPIMV